MRTLLTEGERVNDPQIAQGFEVPNHGFSIKILAKQDFVWEDKRFLTGKIYYIPHRGNIPTENRSWEPHYSMRTYQVNGLLEILDERHFEDKKDSSALNPIHVWDVFHWKKDKSFIVQDFLLPKTINMLFSPPSGYKSLLTLDMCLCIAAGKPWLGLNTKKGKVLILDRENSNKDTRDRVVSLINGHRWRRILKRIELNLLIRNGMLTDQQFITNLHDYVQENDVKLIVIDTLRRFSAFEENSSDDMNKLYTAFQNIINGSNAAILFLHHTNKDETSYRGSVDLLGQVDTAYRVARNKKDNEFKVICEKSRSGEIDELQGTIEWDKEKEITTIARHDITEKEEGDKYAKFKACRTWALNQIAILCPLASNTFLRQALVKELKVDSPDKKPEERFSTRLMDDVLHYLVKTKYLAKTGVKGEYKRIFSNEGDIFKPQGEIN